MIIFFITELIASFFFAIIAGFTYGNDVQVTALAIGLSGFAIASSGKVWMNPIITLSIAFCDQNVKKARTFGGILGQFFGCILGGIVSVKWLREETLVFSEFVTSSPLKALTFEIAFAGFLVFVVLRNRESSNGVLLYGLSYTVTILCGTTLFSGNSLVNPALAFGLLIGSACVPGGSLDKDIWLYIVGPVVGCFIGIMVYDMTRSEDEDSYYNSWNESSETVGSTQYLTRTRGDDADQYVDQSVNVPGRRILN